MKRSPGEIHRLSRDVHNTGHVSIHDTRVYDVAGIDNNLGQRDGGTDADELGLCLDGTRKYLTVIPIIKAGCHYPLTDAVHIRSGVKLESESAEHRGLVREK